MPSLAAMEMGVGGVTSAPELSPHFKTDPKTFLPRLSEEFSSVLTPFILDIYVSSSPSAFLTSIWKQNLEPGVLSPSQAHHLLTSELPKRFRNSPV